MLSNKIAQNAAKQIIVRYEIIAAVASGEGKLLISISEPGRQTDRHRQLDRLTHTAKRTK